MVIQGVMVQPEVFGLIFVSLLVGGLGYLLLKK